MWQINIIFFNPSIDDVGKSILKKQNLIFGYNFENIIDNILLPIMSPILGIKSLNFARLCFENNNFLIEKFKDFPSFLFSRPMNKRD